MTRKPEREPERKTYNASELARVLDISESSVRRLARTNGHVGGIRAIRIGHPIRGRILFSRAEVADLMRSRIGRDA